VRKVGIRGAKEQKNRLKEMPLFVLGLISTPEKGRNRKPAKEVDVIDAERFRSASMPSEMRNRPTALLAANWS
jgi:hypothetical protein